jgi:CheY-like chemotaxis protein
VRTAANGAEALHAAHDAPAPRLILLDLMMPVMDGHQFLEERERDPLVAAIPVAIITAGSDVDKDRVRKTPIVRKPFSVAELLDAVAALSPAE